MAGYSFASVIYIMITNKMDAQINNGTLTVSDNTSRFRAGLMFAGLLIAIAVFPFLIQDTGVDTGFSNLPHVTLTVKQILAQTTSQGVDKVISDVAGLIK